MNNKMAWSNDDTFKFLELYQKEPDIWDPKSKNYKDRIKVNDAWNRLSDAMDMSIDKLKRRKETLMTAYRFHFKKRLEAIKIGSDYTPIWTFYKPMEAFLNDVYGSKTWTNTDDNASTSSRQEDGESDEERRQFVEETTEKKQNILKKRKLSHPAKMEEAISEMKSAFKAFTQVLKQYNQHSDEEEEDECDLYGQLLAKKLRQCSEMERQEIMYEFDGVLLSRRLHYDNSTNGDLYHDHSPPEVIMGKDPVSGSSTPSRSPT